MPELRKNRTVKTITLLLDVSRQRLHKVAVVEAPMSPDLTARIGKLDGNGGGIWLCLWARYENWEAEHTF